ncbi:MAG: tandem-95 repeat protein, partial [Actinomycetales bacterium]
SESGRAFTVAATDPVAGNGQTPGAAASGAPLVAPEKVITSPVSRTVAFNSVDNPIPLTITGGAPTSVAVSTPPTNGTAVATGTAITYTPMAGYFGPDSFQYTATDADGPSSPATVTITVNPQPPIAGASAATVAQNSHNNPLPLKITGGAAVRLIPVSSANGTLAIAGTNVSYSPPQGFNGSAFFTYRAANAGGTSAPATVSIMVTPLPPVAGAVNATVAFGSAGNPIVLSLSGGAAVSVATPTLPTNGTVTVSGTSITYTPAAGYAGPDSFTYTATNAGGTSAPATATITVSPPPAPIAGPVSVTVAASSGANPVTLNLSGGAAVSVATPTPPANGAVSVTGTSITYTPTAGYSGADSFTYT